jgi:dihydroorotate dehydrogenase
MTPYKSFIAPLLFTQDAEKVHNSIAGILSKGFSGGVGNGILKAIYEPPRYARLEQTIWGLKFPHPIGLAAGFDKNASMYKALGAMGFGFVEIGTVTPQPRDGNALPRLFRLKEDRALINRMGFNNAGVEAAVEKLKSRGDLIIGGNIGKNKVTPNEDAINDYLICFDRLKEHVDYFVLNVSSPNTPGLRELQDKEPLFNLIHAISEANAKLNKAKPIVLKIAPDMSVDQLADVADVIKSSGLQGVIATNTTISRSGLQTPSSKVEQMGAGGLSGAPVRNRSTDVIRFMRKMLGDDPVIIGVGGVFNGRDAIEKISAGANLVQAYTGFIYEGPSFVKNCTKEMDHGLKSGHWKWENQRL